MKMVSKKHYYDIDLRGNRLLNFAVESVSGELPSEANEGAVIYHSGEGVMYQRLKDGWKVIASGKDLEDALSKVSEDLQALSRDTEEALDTKADKTTVSSLSYTLTEEIQDRQAGDNTNATAISTHATNKSNPHNVTKAQVGLGNVDNTSDVNKPISTATQTALNKKQATLKAGANITIATDGVTISAKDTTYSVATQSANGLMSSADKKKLDGIASGAQVNVIETVKVNGTALTPSSKAVNIDLSDYAKKGDVTTVMRYKGSVATFSDLPTTPAPTLGDTYNVIDTNANYTWDGSAWDLIGSTVDLSGYATKTEVNSALSDKVSKSGDKMTGLLDLDSLQITSSYGSWRFRPSGSGFPVLSVYANNDSSKPFIEMSLSSNELRLGGDNNRVISNYPIANNDNSKTVATTGWVNTADIVCRTVGAQTIDGQKTFTTPIIDPFNMSGKCQSPNSGASDTPYYCIASFPTSGFINNDRNILLFDVVIGREANIISTATFEAILQTYGGAVFGNATLTLLSRWGTSHASSSAENWYLTYNATAKEVQLWVKITSGQTYVFARSRINSNRNDKASKWKFNWDPTGVASLPAEADGWSTVQCVDMSRKLVNSTDSSATGTEIATADWSIGKFVGLNGDQTIAGEKSFTSTPNMPAIELRSATPFIDFHFGDTKIDYTSRIINDADGQLKFINKTADGSKSFNVTMSTVNQAMYLPVSTPSASTGNEVVTANWSIGKFVPLDGSKAVSGTLTLAGASAASFSTIERSAIAYDQTVKAWTRISQTEVQDSNGNSLGYIQRGRSVAGDNSIYDHLTLSVRGKGNKGECTIKMIAHDDGTRQYIEAPSYIPTTQDATYINSNYLATLKMIGSLNSIVHTTGNETVAGEKSFLNHVRFLARPIIKVTGNAMEIHHTGMDYSTSNSAESFIHFYDKSGTQTARIGVINGASKSVSMNQKWNNVWYDLGIKYDGTNGFGYAPTTPTNAAATEIVTADWYRMKNLTSINLGDATHKFKRLARATISGGWQHIISTIETHKFHNTLTAGGGTGLLKIALNTDASGVIGQVTARWLENEQSMNQFHVLYNSSTVEIWVYNTDSAVLHQYDYWVLRLRECISRVSVDRKSIWDFTSEFTDALPEGMTEVEIELPITVTPTNLADNSKKYATTEWVNTASMVVHTIRDEKIDGIKLFTSPIHIKTDSYANAYFINNGVNVNALGSWQVINALYFYGTDGTNTVQTGGYYISTNANSDPRTVIQTRRLINGEYKIGEITLVVKSNGTSYATCPTPSNDANEIEIVNANWCKGKFIQKTGGTMTGPLNIQMVLPQAYLKHTSDDYTVAFTGQTPETLKFIGYHDKNGKDTFHISEYVYNGGRGLSITLSDASSGSVKSTNLGLIVEKTGGTYATVPTPTSKTDNSLKIATTAWVNQTDFLVHTTGAETIGGIKTFTSNILHKGTNGSLNFYNTRASSELTDDGTSLGGITAFRRKENASDGSYQYAFAGNIVYTAGATYNRMQIQVRRPDGTTTNNAYMSMYNYADGTRYLSIPSPRNDATGTEAVTAKWVNNKLAGKVYISANAPTASDGNDGDIWLQYE